MGGRAGREPSLAVSYAVYKKAILEALPAKPEVPLAAPPAESFDAPGLTCPGCGSSDAVVEHVEDVEVARCPRCNCEFPPVVESVSRQLIHRISERRARQLLSIAEMLPSRAPVPGLNRDDYDLFRKIVDGEPESDPLAEPGVAQVPVEA